ncbi:MAG: WG repeat-containing protein, partial [Cytophagaceae bacterium]
MILRIFLRLLLIFLTFSFQVHAQDDLKEPALYPSKDNALCLYGYKDKNNRWVIAPRFTTAEKFKARRAIVLFNGSYGLINEKGEFVLQPVYDYLEGPRLGNFNELTSCYAFRKNEKAGMIRKDGKIYMEGEYEEISLNFGPCADLVKKGKHGYADTLGNRIEPFSKKELYFSDEVSYFETGLKKGFIDRTGRILIQDFRGRISDRAPYGFIRGKRKKCCVYDIEGKAISACDLDSVIQMNEHGVIYVRSGKYGIMNLKGEIISYGEYERIEPFNKQGNAITVKNGIYNMISSEGKSLLSSGFDLILSYGKKYQDWNEMYFEGYNQFTLVRENNLWGAIDESGKVVIEPKLEYASLSEEYRYPSEIYYQVNCIYHDTLQLIELPDLKHIAYNKKYFPPDNRFIVHFEGKCGMTDQFGKVLIKPALDHIDHFYRGYARFMKDSLYGIMDTMGKIVVPPVYPDLMKEDDAFEWAPLSGRGFLDVSPDYYYLHADNFSWGVLNYKGEKIVDTSYFRISVYDGKGKCWAAEYPKDKWNLIDSTGKVFAHMLDTFSLFRNGVAIVSKNCHFGLISNEGKNLTDFLYDEILEMSDGFYYGRKDNKWTLMNQDGKILSDQEFDKVYPVQNGIGFCKKGKTWLVIDSTGQTHENFNVLSGFRKNVHRFSSVKSMERKDSLTGQKISVISFIYPGWGDVNKYMEIFPEHPDGKFMDKLNHYTLDFFEDSWVIPQEPPCIIGSGCSDGGYDPFYDLSGIQVVAVTNKTVSLNRFSFSGKWFDAEMEKSLGTFKNKYMNYSMEETLRLIKLPELFSAPDYKETLSLLCHERIKKEEER